MSMIAEKTHHYVWHDAGGFVVGTPEFGAGHTKTLRPRLIVTTELGRVVKVRALDVPYPPSDASLQEWCAFKTVVYEMNLVIQDLNGR